MIFKENDPLLKGNTFKFWVDKLERIGENIYEALLLPDIDSHFFPPFHTRSVNISKTLLNYNFFKDQYPNEEINENEFINDIKQGGYYEIEINKLKQSGYLGETEKKFINEQFFNQHYIENTLDSEKFSGEIALSYSDAPSDINVPHYNGKLKGAILYCFNAGQGDSLLFISSNGNSYIIDTNIYYDLTLEEYIKKIKTILRSNKLDDKKIRGLIITHKHIDHIRGASQLIDSGEFNFEYFIINQNYKHETSPVINLFSSASKIPKWINSSNTWEFKDGNTYFCFINPDNNTCNALDINNSSITLCIRDNSNLFYLTGDTGFHILERCYNCNFITDKNGAVLKVSHHGSRTGTSDGFLKLVNPNYAYISAGNHKKYRHPHIETINAITSKNIDYDVSKKYQRSASYKSTSKGIIKQLF